MGSRRRKKKRRRTDHNWRTLTVGLPSLELVKGHDGLLRGKPEPVLMTAAYGLHGDGVQPLGRALRRPRVQGSFPAVILLEAPELFQASIQRTCRRIALLVLALEEDNGADVELIYGALAAPERLLMWPAGAELPSPVALEELDQLEPPPHGELPLNLMLDQDDLRDLCRLDSWIGASLVALPGTHGRWTRLIRFQDSLGQNDWTARLQVKI